MNNLERAEQLVLARNFAEALKILQPIDLSQLSEKDRALCDLLTSEAALGAGNPSLVRDLEAAIEFYRFHPDTSKFARAKYALGWSLTNQVDFVGAQEALLEAYTNFLRYRDLKGIAKSLNRLACVAHHMGDIEAAVDGLEKALRLYRSLNDAEGTASIAANLPLPLLRTGRLKEALTKCIESAPVLEKSPQRMKIVFYLVSAMPHAHWGNSDDALKIIRQVQPLLEQYPLERISYYHYLGWIHLLGDNYARAAEILQKGSELAEELYPGQLVFTAGERLLAEAYICAGRYDDAADIAQPLFTTVSKMTERVEIAACYRIFARIDLHRKKLETARSWFERAIDLFYVIKSRYELAVTRYMAACSDLYDLDESIRLLLQAREYFRSEDVEPYLQKIEKELVRLSQPVKKSKSTTHAVRIDGHGNIVDCPDIIADSAIMLDLIKYAQNVAASELSVLLTGETGTGKDILAKYIHFHSKRPGRFISVNAAAIPDTMVESELFGYAKGAFTNADQSKPGLFEMADRGTFFLDEIADTSPSFQAKLLEVIETRSVRRLGETLPRPVDFRLIAATNQDLSSRIENREFREDLFHRLNQLQLHLPPLRERTLDLLALIRYFMRTSGLIIEEGEASKRLEELSEVLAAHDWPGNVRQLRAEINRLVLESGRDIRQMLTLARKAARGRNEYNELLRALDFANGNQSLAARSLGIPESTLRYRLKKYRNRTP
ncbi:MAG: sigma 54-interacting transcriptional regulator [Candidatus Zixiibacteriota bacterium]